MSLLEVTARCAGRLDVVLDRPRVHNALDRAVRDRLVDAVGLVAADPSVTDVHLRGPGPSFCAGGDLDELGMFPDPATAHLVRLQQSAGRAIYAVATASPPTCTGPVWGRASSWPPSPAPSWPRRPPPSASPRSASARSPARAAP